MPPRLRYQFDREYIDRLIAEDPDTAQHFTSYFGDLLSMKLRSRLRPALIDDAKQETFMRVFATLRRDGLRDPATLGAFVNSVCNNVLFELYRSGAKSTQLEEDYETADEKARSAESAMVEAEEQSRVRDVLAEMPQKDRELLRWLFFEERSKDDVCRALKVDRNYLRVLVHRAKARFRDELQSRTAGADPGHEARRDHR